MSEQPGPGWYADPTSRFDHRYWDGTTWTEHVSRNGQATTDPLDGTGQSAEVWRTQASTSPRTNTKAIVSLVLALIWFGGLASIVAVIVGIMAKREIRDRPGEGGGGVATAGIVIGVIGVLGGLLAFVAFLSFFVFGSEALFVGMG